MFIWNLFKSFLSKKKEQEKTSKNNEDFIKYVKEKKYNKINKNFMDQDLKKLYSFVKWEIAKLYKNDNIDYTSYYITIISTKNNWNWKTDLITFQVIDAWWKNINQIVIDYNSIPCSNKDSLNIVECLWDNSSRIQYNRKTYLLFFAYFLDKLNDKWNIDMSLLSRLISMIKDFNHI